MDSKFSFDKFKLFSFEIIPGIYLDFNSANDKFKKNFKMFENLSA